MICVSGLRVGICGACADLDPEERLVDVLWVRFVEPGEHLEVPEPVVRRAVELS